MGAKFFNIEDLAKGSEFVPTGEGLEFLNTPVRITNLCAEGSDLHTKWMKDSKHLISAWKALYQPVPSAGKGIFGSIMDFLSILHSQKVFPLDIVGKTRGMHIPLVRTLLPLRDSSAAILEFMPNVINDRPFIYISSGISLDIPDFWHDVPYPGDSRYNKNLASLYGHYDCYTYHLNDNRRRFYIVPHSMAHAFAIAGVLNTMKERG